ncbi:UvrD-helicase domain-containing protein [Hyphobacterium indicum]|uniref:UvrD-helicase domain-containing protein n=1 Tax=Hyphobacterium indicum TaxID=2162714 RepID=UPI000D64AF2D|nr:UvrD-helicase domain-containing protein [Hyphobacterium indicum]
MRWLVLDNQALEVLAQAQVDESWFENFNLPSGENRIKKVTLKDAIVLLGSEPCVDARLVFFRIDRKGLFYDRLESSYKDGVNSNTLDRCVTLALSILSNSVALPKSFKPHRQGNLVSIYANRFQVQEKDRVHFALFQDAKHIVGFHRSPEVVDFRDLTVPQHLDIDTIWLEAVEAVESGNVDDSVASGSGINLEPLLGKSFVGEATLDDWISSKLTTQQRSFVDAPLDKPRRLRGVAGTGKTLALTIKCLKELYASMEREEPLRVAFLTHTASVATDVVSEMIRALDHRHLVSSAEPGKLLWLGSLYQLAKETLNYDTKGILPISDDGVEGRLEQREWIALAIEEIKNDIRVTEDFLKRASPSIASEINAARPSDQFLRELANEIACVLDAEGIRKSKPELYKAYLHKERQAWQMRLPNEADRQIVVEIYEKYYNFLIQHDAISLDHMIADFAKYLETHEWVYRKKDAGFDIIFVDELHYFNFIERMIFHHLFRHAAADGAVPLFMAYDLKQGTDDRFLNTGVKGEAARFFKQINVGPSEVDVLDKVFRSTPEIARFLSSVDSAFPALDLEGEWQDYSATSARSSGDIPVSNNFDNDISMLDAAMFEAAKFAKAGSGTAAVLCLNEEKFQEYKLAGRVQNLDPIVIDSRDEVKQTRYAKKRPVFAMPEAVAGLQFDHVILIHADRSEYDDSESAGLRRRFLSRFYLGASRASKSLSVFSSEGRGGELAFVKSSKNANIIR